MPRVALILLPLLLQVRAVPLGAPASPHVDMSQVPASCASCHAGHGRSRSPMLPAPQSEVCARCHASQTEANAAIAAGLLAPGARPSFLSQTLSMPFVHPLALQGFSVRDGGLVVCTSCHSPHRGMAGGRSGAVPDGARRASPKDPTRAEYELCESCHGNAGATTQSLTDVSRLFNPSSRSYHPVEAPSAASSQSVLPGLAGQLVNCTDCHGNDDPQGPRGPHGSRVRFLLRAAYTTVDGEAESAGTFALCYLCHDREKVLRNQTFPQHRKHIVDLRAACATCHSAHGSVNNRALIRYGEDTSSGGVGPSVKANRLAFVSDVAGSGACYLTCHGKDHGPETYGAVPPASLDRRLVRPRR